MGMTVEVAASLLGVEVGASKDEISSAFKTRSRLVHPDRVSGESEKAKASAEELMKQLNMAKEVLLAFKEDPFASSDINNDSDSSSSGKTKGDNFHKDNTGKPGSKAKKEEPVLTVEEQIELLRSERQADIDEAKAVMKDLALVYLVNLTVLIVVAIFEVGFIMSWVDSWDFWFMLASVAGLVATVYMWRRTLARFYAFNYSLGELNAYKRLARQEEKQYRRLLKPDNPESLLNKFKRFNDRF